MEGYKVTDPVDCTGGVDTSVLKDKTAIVTGGANGIGEAYARALCAVEYVYCSLSSVNMLHITFPSQVQTSFFP